MKKILKIRVDNERISLSLLVGAVLVKKKSLAASRKQAEKLLPAIASFTDKSELSRIEINNSGASFTALRIGVTTANALAYAWNLEIAGNENDSFILAGREYPAPCYDHAPNIT